MTVFCPLTVPGAARLVVTADEPRFVVDCKVNPVALVGQLKMTFAPAGVIVSCGRVTGNVMLNIVPLPQVPPRQVVPYKLLPVKSNGAPGQAPLFGEPAKLWSTVYPEPSLLSAKTVPWPALPPPPMVP